MFPINKPSHIMTSPHRFTDRKEDYTFSNAPFSQNQNYTHTHGHMPQQIPFASKNELDTQNYSYRILKSLQLSQKFLPKLKLVNHDYTEEIEIDAEKYKISDNIDYWMINLKHFLVKFLIPNVIIDSHFENIDHLNKYLEAALNLQVQSSMLDENDPSQVNFYDDISNAIKFAYKSDINNPGFSRASIQSSGFNLLSSQDDKKQFRKVFFGDNEKLMFIHDRICEKIKELQYRIREDKDRDSYRDGKEISNGTQSLSKTLFSNRRHKDGVSTSNLNFPSGNGTGLYQHHIMKNKFVHEMDNIESRNLSTLENLKKLNEFIDIRINLNDRLTPYFVKEISYQHKMLAL